MQAQHRFGEGEARSAGMEGVLVAGDQMRVGEHGQGVVDATGVPAEFVRDLSASGAAAGDGGEHGVVGRRVGETGFLGEQHPAFAEHRPGGVE